jgi:hypothetical protein
MCHPPDAWIYRNRSCSSRGHQDRIFLYIFFCFDFQKINRQTRNFEKYTSTVVPHGARYLPPRRTAAAPLPPYPMALRPYRHGVRRQENTPGGRAARHNTRTMPPCATVMVKVLLHLKALVPLRPNNSSASPGVVPVVRLGVRCPDHPRSELVGEPCRHGPLRRACTIRCPSAGRCRSARRCPSARKR